MPIGSLMWKWEWIKFIKTDQNTFWVPNNFNHSSTVSNLPYNLPSGVNERTSN